LPAYREKSELTSIDKEVSMMHRLACVTEVVNELRVRG